MSINWRDKTLGGTILIVAGLVGAALAVVADALPSRFPAGSTPPQLLLAAFGLIVIFGVAIIIALAVKFGLGLSRTTIVTVFTFNVAIVIVKFVLSPLGLYASNASAPFNAQAFLVGINNNMEGFVVAAVGSFLAYLVALTIIYRIVTRDMRTSSSPHKGRYRMVVLVVGALVLLAILGAQSVLIPLFVAELPVAALGDYVSKLLPTLPLILVALGLGTVFAVMAFKSTSADAKLLRKPTLIASLFWLCLCLVFMYHVLWVVFMTAMVTIWPFKTFVPNTK